jgi:hypothetical protein
LANGDSLNLKPYLLAEMVFKFLDYDPAVSIREPETRVLSAENFPNPFRTETEIRYQITQAGFVNISVYDILGNHITDLVNMEQTAGNQSVNWDATNIHGVKVEPGIYFYRIVSDNEMISGKMTVY